MRLTLTRQCRLLKRLSIACVLLIAACQSVTPSPAHTVQALPGEPVIALVNGELIDGTGADPLPDQLCISSRARSSRPSPT